MAEIKARKKRKKAEDAWLDDTAPVVKPNHPLDAPQVQKRLRKVQEWWKQARLAQGENRIEQAIDQDFKDGDQWKPEDIVVLEDRGQAPLVFNLIATTVRWVTGTEKRTRVDYRVLPRKKDSRKDAESKTSLMKYVADVNKEGFHRSKAFEDTVTVGIGWLEDGIRSDPMDEPLFARYESWRNMWYDPLSIEPDMSDARYVFRVKWIDLDIAQAMFPDRAAELKIEAENVTNPIQMAEDRQFDNPYLYADAGIGSLGDVDNVLGVGTRERVKLIECWYRIPCQCQVIRDDGHKPYNGAIYKKGDPVHEWAVENGASLYDAVKMQVRCMIFAGKTVLQDKDSPYWHNKFPFTAIFAYRKGRNNAPYGLVRGLRDPQEDLNKRRSKALQLLSTRRVIADEDAVSDWDELYDEVSRADAVIRKKKGSDLQIQENAAFAQQHVVMMDQSARYIQEVGGVTDENLGRQTNAISGKAIESRQNQGYTTTSDLFDNLRLAIQITGERRLSLIEQFYDDEKTLRLTGERGRQQFVDINAQDVDPITLTAADFVVDEQDYRGTVRQAMFDSILEMSTKLPPEVGLKLLTLGFEMSDVPMRDEFVAVLREITGMEDPNKEVTPEEEAAAAEAQQAEVTKAQAASDMQDAVMKIQLQEAMAKLKLIEGQAKKAEAEGNAKELTALITKLDAMKRAIELAGGVAAAPKLAMAADQIMQDVTAVPVVNNIPPGLPAGVN